MAFISRSYLNRSGIFLSRVCRWCSANATDALNDDPLNNVPVHIAEKLGRNLHLLPDHPLCTIRSIIEDYWQRRHRASGGPPFSCERDLHPIVSVRQCFDDLLIPIEHVSRRPSDTYYVDSQRVLRTHTSAHQSTLLSLKQRDVINDSLDAFLVSGDVYRRDEIDRSHYPVFHQMEGVRMFQSSANAAVPVDVVVADLKEGLEGMARELFGDVDMRWVDAYFPFTEPSFELEVFYDGDWLEVLGCGVIEKAIVAKSGRNPDEEIGWAFGLGLERLAMVLFSIPDIRLFWSTDPRFLDQFRSTCNGEPLPRGRAKKFKPYSRFPPCLKDISFWLPDGAVVLSSDDDLERRGLFDSRSEAQARAEGRFIFHPNDLFEVVRGVAGDMVETVEFIDDFTHPKTGRRSQCYRIVFRHMDRNLTNEEVDAVQLVVRNTVREQLGVELR